MRSLTFTDRAARPMAVSLIALMLALPAGAQTSTPDMSTEDQATDRADSATSAGADTGADTGSDAGSDTGSDSGETASGEGSAAASAPSVTDDGQSPAGQDGTVTAEDVGIGDAATGDTAAGANGGMSDAETADAIEEADAPTTAVTDTRGESTGLQQMPQEDGAMGQQPGQSAQMQMPQGQMQPGASMVLDLEAFSQDVYERGFRQGYVRGISEARMRMASELQRGMERRMEMQQMRQQSGSLGTGTDQTPDQAPGTQQAQDGQTIPGGGQAMGQQPQQQDGTDQQSGMTGGASGAQMPQAAQNPQATLNTDDVGPANPTFGQQGMDGRQGGTIVILPPGMDVETFIRQVEAMSR